MMRKRPRTGTRPAGAPQTAARPPADLMQPSPPGHDSSARQTGATVCESPATLRLVSLPHSQPRAGFTPPGLLPLAGRTTSAHARARRVLRPLQDQRARRAPPDVHTCRCQAEGELRAWLRSPEKDGTASVEPSRTKHSGRKRSRPEEGGECCSLPRPDGQRARTPASRLVAGTVGALVHERHRAAAPESRAAKFA